MSIHLTVFCRTGDVITRRELAEFIEEGAYFEDDFPTFDAPTGPCGADQEWSSLEIRYARGKRPITIERFTDETTLALFVNEALDKLNRTGMAEANAELVHHIRQARQIFVLEAGSLAEDDDAWEMLDSTEAYIARELDGVIVADEGFYDQNLKPICKLR